MAKSLQTTITINGIRHVLFNTRVDYYDIVSIAYGPSHAMGPHVYTVVYSNGPDSNREGSLIPSGKSVEIRNNMHFDACITGNA